MTGYWTFRDYVSPDGTNEVHAWLNGLVDKRAKVKINARIRYLENVRIFPAQYAKWLEGDCDGLAELRIGLGRIEYRPLYCLGPGERELTILIGATEKNGKFVPLTACETALARKLRLNEKGRTCDHDFS